MSRVVCWFSCGAASAVATVKAKEKYGEIEAVYCRVQEEHEDNWRFIKDFERVTGIPVKVIMNEEHQGSIYDVFLKRKFIKNQQGAPCTMLLKKEMRKQYQLPDDIQVFGYTAEEKDRADRFLDANNEVQEDFILIEQGITKQDCYKIVSDMGIELPVMYRLGYSNNNCVGCVKGGMGYWNKIRVDFPEVFDKMAKVERLIGHSINKDKNGRVFLDELDPNRGHAVKDAPGDCGFTCEVKSTSDEPEVGHCHIDIETFSEVDLIKAGAYRYAEDESTDILCVCYAFGDGPINLWVPADALPKEALPDNIDGNTIISPRCPDDLAQWMGGAKECRAHNAAFERVVMNGVAGDRYHIPKTKPEQWVCTAAKAASYALPRNLEDAARETGAPAKSKAGRSVMLKLSKPRRATKKMPETRWSVEMAPKDYNTLYAYCADDVRAERGVDKRLKDLSDYEQRVYVLDQRINDHGLLIDTQSVDNVQFLVEKYRADLEQRCAEITGGIRVGQTAALANWIREQGYDIENLQAETIAQTLKDPAVPKNVREVVKLRYLHSMKAPAKYTAMQKAVCKDNRLRGMFIYHGAATGRWVSKGVQLQNLHRGYVKDPNIAIEAYRQRKLDWIKWLYEIEPMKVFASTVRGMITAPKGHDIMALDFGQIEARVLAWMCGQEEALDVFRANQDIYVHAAARIFGVPQGKVDDDMRFAGKISTLSCGYQGAVGAYTRMAKNYGANVEEAVALSVVKDWREANPMIVKSWYAVEAAAKEAIYRKGEVVQVRDRNGDLLPIGKHISFKVHRGFLRMRLPSGRMLSFFKPQIDEEEKIRYWGIDTFTRKWCLTSTYGGSLVQSATQAIARDLMVNGMLKLDEAGYGLIGTVHDEVIMELPDDFGSVEEASKIMCDIPKWAAGLPVKASGYRAKRYRKD